MSVSYNLVIVGGSLTARYAADYANRLKARVALVEPDAFRNLGLGIESEAIIIKALQQVAQDNRSISDISLFNQYKLEERMESVQESGPILWSRIRHWVNQLIIRSCYQFSLESLALQGVDVIIGDRKDSSSASHTGEFCRRPHFGFVVCERLLRSHAYLLAPQSYPRIPEISGLASVPYITFDTLLMHDMNLNGHAVILGETYRGIELAQVLARLGMNIVLVIQESKFLLHEDEEGAEFLLALLEATGVVVLVGKEICHVEQINSHISVKVGDHVILTNHLILATTRQAHYESFNLEAANLVLTNGKIQVTSKLRTTHPRIYACGEITHDSDISTVITRNHVKKAVNNALFLITRKRQEYPVPRMIYTDPPFAQVGLTEQNAAHRFGDKVITLTVPINRTIRAYIDGNDLGFLKVILHQNGRLIGACGVGRIASELIGAIALAIQEHLPLWKLTQSYIASVTQNEILSQLTLLWESERLNRNHSYCNIQELIMSWQRDWSGG